MSNRKAATILVSLMVSVPGLAWHLVHPPSLPYCLHEDGNLNGKPCVWSDPDTGTEYMVDSGNYR